VRRKRMGDRRQGKDKRLGEGLGCERDAASELTDDTEQFATRRFDSRCGPVAMMRIGSGWAWLEDQS